MIRKLMFVLMGVFILLTVSYWQERDTKAMEVSPKNLDQPDWVNPTHIEALLKPGETHSETIDVTTGDNPIDKGDVMFVFDLTSSMKDELDEVKDSANDIMGEVATELPDTWFGVASFMDYPGTYSYPGYTDTYGVGTDKPWVLDANPDDNIPHIANVVNGLTLGQGADFPESYSRMLFELSNSVNWRENSKKIAVVFGDAATHDLDFNGDNYGGDPGRDGIAQTADDLDFETVVKHLNDQSISILAVNSSTYDHPIPTFKGMSIGYGLLEGTNGAYFKLSNTADLPGATVDLILSETSIIDRLSLVVTEGYEDWVDISPGFYEDVGPNTRKSFTVKITPPEGTDPGGYSFNLHANGDGNILGITYVDITVPSDSASIDLGFRPSKDGFKFGNDGSIPPADWFMFRQFFGADVVEYPNGDPKHAANAFFKESYSTIGEGGDCDGFTSTSSLNFFNLSQPNAGDFSMLHYDSLYKKRKIDDIKQAITFNQAIQESLEFKYYLGTLAAQFDNSPSKLYEYVKGTISNGVPTIGYIHWNQKYCAPAVVNCVDSGAHSLLPYRFEDVDSNTAYLYVYDPNRPGDDNRRIEFNLKDDTWTYKWHVPLAPDIPVSGDDSYLSIGFTPLEIYRHKGIAPWKMPDRSRELFEEMPITSYRVIDASGRLQMQFVDGSGRILGFDGGNFIEEIPGTFYIPNPESDHTEGSYFIPIDTKVDISFVSGGSGKGNLQFYEDGSLIDLSLNDMDAGSEVDLDPGAGGDSLSVGVRKGSINPGITVSKQLPGEDRTVSIGGGTVVERESLGVGIVVSDDPGDTNNIAISGDVVREKSLDVTIHRAGGSGYQVFGSSNVDLDGNFYASAGISDWTDIDDIELAVDWDQDGSINEVKQLTNDATPSNIVIQADKTRLEGLGGTVQLIVGVQNQYGSYVQNGTHITIHTSSGTITAPVNVTSGGLVYAGFIPNSYGSSTIVVGSGDAEASIEIFTEKVHKVQLPLSLYGYSFPPPQPNRRPTTPSNPSPADGSEDRSIFVNLYWAGGDPDGDRVTYDVKFEAGDNTPDKVVCADSATTFCDPGSLDENTKYYWQVVARDEQGETRAGPVWSFKTIARNSPPYVPSNSSPDNGSVDQDVNVDLEWNGGDPDGDSVTYDVKFEAGDNTPENIICDDTSSTLCDPGTLSKNTKYYWQVVARDEHGLEKEGPVWSFTTKDDPPPSKTWQPVGSSSASGGGISINGGDSGYPLLAVSPTDNYPVVAWHDNSGGDYEIYVKRWNGSSWQALDGSASGGGISQNGGKSQYPYVAIAQNGTPYVVWVDDSSGKYQIYLKYWDGNSWEPLGNSASGGGVSSSPTSARSPSITIGPDGRPYVGYRDNSSGNYEIYLKKWNGSSWQALGGSASSGGISQNSGFSGRTIITVADSGQVCVSWQDRTSGNYEIYLKCLNGSSWQQLGNSASGGGISSNGGDSLHNTMALDSNGRPIVAWYDISAGNNEIYLKRWNGGSWQPVGNSASGGGISNNGTDSIRPAIVIDSADRIHVTWRDKTGNNMEIYSKYWNGANWVEHQSGSASGGGLSMNGGASEWPPLAIGPDDVPYVTWMDKTSGNYEIYVKRWK